MITEIAFSCYPVKDMARARDFYQNKLGKHFKVIRGLSWSPIGHYDAEDAKAVVRHYSRASYRLFYYPNDGLEDLGFRCVKPA